MRDMETPGGEAGRSKAVMWRDVFEHSAKSANRKAERLVFETADGPQCAAIAGRELWALRALMAAGAVGVTPLSWPGPRWSCYIHRLRGRGLDIETLREAHGGDFPGRHGRYVRRSPVALAGGSRHD